MEERTDCGKYAHKYDVSLNLIDAQEYRGLNSVPELQRSFAPMSIGYLTVCMCVSVHAYAFVLLKCFTVYVMLIILH